MRPIWAWRAKVSALAVSFSSASASASAVIGGGEIGRRIIARVEADVVGLAEIGDGGFGAGIGGAVADPHRLVVARLVEGFDAGAVGLAADGAVERLAGDQFAQFVGDGAVGGRGHGHRRGRRVWPARPSGRRLGTAGFSGGRPSFAHRHRNPSGSAAACRRAAAPRSGPAVRRLRLLRLDGLAGQNKHQSEGRRRQQTVKSNDFHREVSQKAEGG